MPVDPNHATFALLLFIAVKELATIAKNRKNGNGQAREDLLREIKAGIDESNVHLKLLTSHLLGERHSR